MLLSAFHWPLAEVNSFSLFPFRFLSSLHLVMKFDNWWNAIFFCPSICGPAVHSPPVSLTSFLSALQIFWVQPWTPSDSGWKLSTLQPLVGAPLFPHWGSPIAILLSLNLQYPWAPVRNFRSLQHYRQVLGSKKCPRALCLPLAPCRLFYTCCSCSLLADNLPGLLHAESQTRRNWDTAHFAFGFKINSFLLSTSTPHLEFQWKNGYMKNAYFFKSFFTRDFFLRYFFPCSE